MPSTEVTQLLQRVASGDLQCASELLPLVYSELRQLAAARLANEAGPITLQPTALVHEAYLRLISERDDQYAHRWEGRRHFFGAASEAMRRIVVEGARRRQSLKRGGELGREELCESRLLAPDGRNDEELLSIHEFLDRLAAVDAEAAEVVKLRYFTGLSVEETAAALNISDRTVKRRWAYARAWLLDAMVKSEPVLPGE